jgi:probable phosphoglycerate mutase
MHIIAVRHGETNENAAGIIQGQSLGTLSAKGVEQTEAVGRKLAEAQFDVCISSDLERCRRTSAAILAHHPGINPEFDVRFRERSMKPFEGKYFTEVHWEWEKDGLLDFKSPEGETWSEVIGRVAEGLNALHAKYAHERVMIVSHGGPMRAMLALFEGGLWSEIGRTQIDNCEVREWDMVVPVDGARVR